ncbi:MAG: 2-hydroxychromene-2-carboxylate isomerase [Patiriisocius sp.]|jgi:2-hydroxychromene-2-carboxylate isomerase
MTQLDIYLDLGNIAGMAAISGTLKLIEETGVTAVWQPIEGNVPRPLSRVPNLDNEDPIREFKQKRLTAKRQFEMAELERDCARLELDVELASRTFDARLTHLACLAILEQVESPLIFMQQVYESRFREGDALEDESSVADMLETFRIQKFVSCLPQLRYQWEQHQSSYLELGIHDTPSYVLEGETFQGRQHLPLLRWRLEGEVGPPPL